MSKQVTTFTNAAPGPKIDLESLCGTRDAFMGGLADTFKGLKVVVDGHLRGGAYYVAVSQELYDQLHDAPEAGKEQG